MKLTGPVGFGNIFISNVDLPNNPTFGQLGGSGGGGDETAWCDLGQSSFRVNDNNTYLDDSCGTNFEGLEFDGIPPCLAYEGLGVGLDEQLWDFSTSTQNICDPSYPTNQAYNDLGWQHFDPEVPLEQISTLFGADADVSRWASNILPGPMIQDFPPMHLDLTSRPLVDLSMQSWGLQDIHSSSPPIIEEQLGATLQLGQNAYAGMSPFGRQTEGSTSTAHTPGMTWQTGIGSSSSTSPASSNGDQFACDHPGC